MGAPSVTANFWEETDEWHSRAIVDPKLRTTRSARQMLTIIETLPLTINIARIYQQL